MPANGAMAMTAQAICYTSTVVKENVGVVSRSMNNPATGKPFESARDVVARDIKKLRRVYPEISNGQLRELIAMNKSMYIEIRVKRAGE